MDVLWKFFKDFMDIIGGLVFLGYVLNRLIHRPRLKINLEDNIVLDKEMLDVTATLSTKTETLIKNIKIYYNNRIWSYIPINNIEHKLLPTVLRDKDGEALNAIEIPMDTILLNTPKALPITFKYTPFDTILNSEENLTRIFITVEAQVPDTSIFPLLDMYTTKTFTYKKDIEMSYTPLKRQLLERNREAQ